MPPGLAAGKARVPCLDLAAFGGQSRRAMTPKDKTGPKLSPDGERERAARRAREAEALRANLLKRKAQARGRATERPDPASQPPHPGRPRGG